MEKKNETDIEEVEADKGVEGQTETQAQPEREEQTETQAQSETQEQTETSAQSETEVEKEKGSGSKKKFYMKWAKRLFLVLVLLFMARYFYRNYDDYKNLNLTINWKIFLVAVLFYFTYKITLASLWHYLTILSECNIRWAKAVTAYLYSILGKYIPGKVFMLLARIPAYEEEGKSIAKVTVCFFLENICTLLGAAFLFLISLFFFPNDLLKQYQWASIGLVIAFFICINPRIINFFLGKIGKLFKKDNLNIPITYLQMIKVVGLFVCNWLISGCGFYMLTCSIYPLPWSQFLYAAGIFGISCFIGIVALFAPSGIGVREGVMVLGLSLIMPKEYAVIISIVSRLWMSVSELILILVAFLINKVKAYRQKKEKLVKEEQENG